jgi:hypothetical protein
MKKSEPKVCEWCGTRIRGDKTTCSRGPFCATEQAEHEALMERIRKGA